MIRAILRDNNTRAQASVLSREEKHKAHNNLPIAPARILLVIW